MKVLRDKSFPARIERDIAADAYATSFTDVYAVLA